MSVRSSPWRSDAHRRTAPPGHLPATAEVVVAGGGICGLTTALLLRREGAEVTVVEARRCGDGTTLDTTGKVTSQHGAIYATVVVSGAGLADPWAA